MHPADDALLVDEHERAVVVAALLDQCTVGARDLALGMKVGEQRYLGTELLAKGGVGIGVVDADAEELSPRAPRSPGSTSW